MEEERRLFYVGVTRARDILYLSGAAYRSQYGNLKLSPESRFVRDIPRRHLEVVRREGAAAESPGERLGTEDEGAPASSFRVGDSVLHDAFGEGVVTGMSRSRSGTEVTVNFPAAGEKLLLLKYAPLRKA